MNDKGIRDTKGGRPVRTVKYNSAKRIWEAEVRFVAGLRPARSDVAPVFQVVSNVLVRSAILIEHICEAEVATSARCFIQEMCSR